MQLLLLDLLLKLLLQLRKEWLVLRQRLVLLLQLELLHLLVLLLQLQNLLLLLLDLLPLRLLLLLRLIPAVRPHCALLHGRTSCPGSQQRSRHQLSCRLPSRCT